MARVACRLTTLLIIAAVPPLRGKPALTQHDALQSLLKRERTLGVGTEKHAQWIIKSIESIVEQGGCGALNDSFVGPPGYVWPSARYGSDGDGGWYLCASPELRSPSCTIYSVGIGFDFSFDHAAASLLPHCQVHMMDPTPTVITMYKRASKALPYGVPPNLHFHAWGVGDHDHDVTMNNWWTEHSMNANQNRIILSKGKAAANTPSSILTLSSIARRLGHSTPPTVLKLDVEGAEWDLVSILPTCGAQQLMFELHDKAERWLPLLSALVGNGGYRLWRVEEASYKVDNSTGKIEHGHGKIVLYLYKPQ